MNEGRCGSGNGSIDGTSSAYRHNRSISGPIDRTHRAFMMPIVPSRHNLLKTGKRQYRNPIYLAREWQTALDHGEHASPAALARHLRVSRARVTQILNLMKLSPEVINLLDLLGDPSGGHGISERRLRPQLALSAQQQEAQAEITLSTDKDSKPYSMRLYQICGTYTDWGT